MSSYSESIGFHISYSQILCAKLQPNQIWGKKKEHYIKLSSTSSLCTGGLIAAFSKSSAATLSYLLKIYTQTLCIAVDRISGRKKWRSNIYLCKESAGAVSAVKHLFLGVSWRRRFFLHPVKEAFELEWKDSVAENSLGKKGLAWRMNGNQQIRAHSIQFPFLLKQGGMEQRCGMFSFFWKRKCFMFLSKNSTFQSSCHWCIHTKKKHTVGDAWIKRLWRVTLT